jgi:hypothetical protein
MLVEVAVASAIVGALLVVCLQLVSAAAAQRRAADQRHCALLEIGNVMEQVAARPWDELTTAALSQETLSPSAASQLPGAELKIEVSASTADPAVKRITVALRYQDRAGRLLVPVTITTWRYKIVN